MSEKYDPQSRYCAPHGVTHSERLHTDEPLGYIPAPSLEIGGMDLGSGYDFRRDKELALLAFVETDDTAYIPLVGLFNIDPPELNITAHGAGTELDA